MNIDITITNSQIYDGLGNKPVRENIGIHEGKIVYPVDKNSTKWSDMIIDGEGLAIAPGFINIHSHSDSPILVDGTVPSCIHQGITTEVTGNCGFSLAPLGGEELEETKESFKRNFDMDVTWRDFQGLFNLMEEKGISVNILSLAGHGTLRGSIVGLKDRALNKEETIQMAEAMDTALKHGVFGLSTGLIYPPGCYSTTGELIDIAKTLKNRGLYSSHIRGEGQTLINAIEEAIEIGKAAQIPVEISHLKAAGERNWGKTAQALEIIRKAREEGLFIQHDQYPYTASATGLSMMVPSWVHDGGKEGLVGRLKNEEIREKIKKEMIDEDYPNGRSILISHVTLNKNKKYEGREINELAQEEDTEVFDFILNLLLEEEGQVEAIYMSMDEKDVRRVMSDPYTAIGTDATAHAVKGPLHRGKPHPRTYGTFPRVLGYYARDLNLFTMEEGIRKMTSLPAKILGLKDRGLICNGYSADLVIFNPRTIIDMGTYQEPHAYPAGIEYVLVNGKIVMERGEILPVKPGKVIKNKC